MVRADRKLWGRVRDLAILVVVADAVHLGHEARTGGDDVVSPRAWGSDDHEISIAHPVCFNAGGR